MKLLMHTCCAPCSIYCIDELRKNGIEPTLYWYNPNIHPYTEYIARRDCLKEYANIINVKTIFNEEYGLDEFCKNVADNINARCVEYCYPIRLRKTFEYAKKNGYDTVTTTLLYSIYQKHEYIKKLMEDLSREFDINFLYIDFRKGFWIGHDKAIEQGLYMQKYCGCIFSEEDRYLNRNISKPTLPEGYEQLKRQRLELKKIENKEAYIDLLLEAIPSKDIILKYLQESDCYGLKRGDEIVSLAVIFKSNKKIIELKALVTKQEYRNKGYAKKILKSLCGNYKQKYEKMLVGTAENNIPFYVKLGFDKYEKTVKDYFITNYSKEIKCENFVYTDLIYYSKNLNEKM